MPSPEGDLDLRPSSHSAFTTGEYTFADVNNLEHCAKYLNQSLVTFGFPASLDLFSNDPVSIARTCNCIYFLLQQRQRDVEFRESANEQRQRLLSDISRYEAKVERLDGQLQAKDREIATITRTEAKNTAALKAQIEKLQKERDEFQRMVIGNQQVRTQQIHEMKKKEKEYIKLQERLNQVLMEKKKESRSGMEIMNLLQKEGRQRGTWNGKKTDNDFYKKIVDAYEVKNQELIAENADLRALLRSMQVDMRDFLNAPNGLPNQSPTTNEKSESNPSHSPMVGRTDVFDLPFHMARDQIEESLRAKMASIKERMVQLQDAQKEAEVTSEATERELELEAQLVEARSIIQEQASIMSKHLAKSDRPRESAPAENRESQTLLPLTIKQINHALQSSDDRTGLTIDGVGVYTVTLVGRVCNKSGQITEFKFVLDDGTGTIECTKWLHEPADAMAVESIMNGMYVRLYGQLKGFHGKQTLSIFSLRPVTDFNEIASHFLECIYVHLYNSKLQHTQASIPNQQHAPNSIQSTATKGYQAQAIPPNQFSGQQNNGQKSVHDLVLEFLALPTNRAMEGGISCESIANNLGVSLDKVIPALDVLGSEGLVYEGLPMHYKICSDG